MTIQDIINVLENYAPPALQESYDNVGLLIGNKNWNCTGIICCLDSTEDVIKEAISKKCNLIVAHHPIIFSGLKKLNGSNYVEQTIIKAIKNDIAIYAIHTNLDNLIDGVNKSIADKLNLKNTSILLPKNNMLQKLYTFVPINYAEKVKEALFAVGAGEIGNYSECSFNTKGIGTFNANQLSNPFVGNKGLRHEEVEIKVEIIYPIWLKSKIINTLKNVHPYEEPAFDIISLQNQYNKIGSGLIGELAKPISAKIFLQNLSKVFDLQIIRHSKLNKKNIKKVAICGGAGNFLTTFAMQASADIFITSDIKYHEFFDTNSSMILVDIGHFESEQFTIELLQNYLQKKFPNFAVLKTKVKTNPVEYFIV